MDAALRKSISELGNVAESFKDVQSRVEALEGKGSPIPADLKEQLARVNDAVTAADNAKTSIDEVLKQKKEDAKRLSDLETKNTDLQNQLEELAMKGGRIDSGSVSAEDAEHQKAYREFLLKGRTDALDDINTRAVSTVVDSEGGYVVPESIDLAIIKAERDFNPMRQICGSLVVNNGNYKLPASIGNAGSGWVGEKAARPQTNTPTIAQLAMNMGEIYANPATTKIALEDMAIDVEAWLAEEVAIQFAEQENAVFTSGDGTDKPKGLLAYATSAVSDKAGTRPFETLQELTSGASGTIVSDDLITLIHSLRGGYRNNARFMMSGLTLAAIRTMKDANNNYLWRPGLEEGQASNLLGYAVAENEDMPEVTDGAGSKAIAFGDFTRGYLVVDRLGTSVLRDKLTNKPYIHFYTTKRVGGLLRDSLAIKLLAVAA